MRTVPNTTCHLDIATLDNKYPATTTISVDSYFIGNFVVYLCTGDAPDPADDDVVDDKILCG